MASSESDGSTPQFPDAAFLEEVRARDGELFAIIDSLPHGLLAKTVVKCRGAVTLRALVSFSAKASMLKNAIFDLAHSGDSYASKIVFRSLIEHYLKYMYLFVRLGTEQSDEAGNDYYMFCGAAEMLDYGRALVAEGGLLGKEFAPDFMSAATAMYPKLATSSEREIREKSGRFKYRAILRYLASHEAAFVSPERPFLSKLIPEYAELSSYTHGGPIAEMDHFGVAFDERSDRQSIEWAFMLATSIWCFTFSILGSVDKDIAKAGEDIHNGLQEWMRAHPDEDPADQAAGRRESPHGE